ncbi:tyrosine-protein kinase family protein [Modicisalibacter radicis]|uniref:tyrosine-protein kinase family protein n=1 Tax=Halomonas sp. EAR18 TaxID=2518972 RepID=UPI00109D72A4|nr:P-loop NTPase [Halomonas sp. EAR18]
MNTTELTSSIEAVLAEQGFSDVNVVAVMDPEGGWMLRIISLGFADMSDTERRQVIAGVLAGEQITWREFLTPEEAKEAGPMPSAEASALPLWPESLARGSYKVKEQALVRFLSDGEDELTPPITATFYSLRGGVGRSTSLAHTARLLARAGKQVVCLDMDIEAPGLAALFNVEHEVERDRGVVELLMQLDQGSEPDFSHHLLPVDDEGRLFLIPAGLPDAKYANDLSLLDPSAWYTEEANPLRMLMQGVREGLPFTPDVILIDSRTGISAISAPLLFEQADLAVVAMFPHEQARRGTEALVQGLMAASNHRSAQSGREPTAPEIRFLVGPLPATPQLSQALYHRALEWVAEWLSPVQKVRQDNGLLELNEGDITHWVPYQEALAASQHVLEINDIDSLYRPVADWVTGLLPMEENEEAPPSTSWEKIDILDDVYVDTGAAEDQKNLLDVFIETDVVRRALDLKRPLVLGRKGTGKTALFRRIKEEHGESNSVMPVMSPLPDNVSKIRLGEALFKELENNLVEPQAMQWNQVWMTYLLVLACEKGCIDTDFIADQLLEKPLPNNTVEFVHWMKYLSSQPMFSLRLETAFQQFDQSMEKPLTLLWDGLDTQFGNAQTDRKRRASALVGLISMVLEWEKRLENIRFKVLLREDIWRELRFENKSHLYGRSVMLQWGDQNSFLKVLVKQLWRSKKFAGWIKAALPSPSRLDEPFEQWTDDDVIDVWHLIVGVRMSGGRTAFTRNWIWTRLADANNDHAPRHLLQLLGAAVEHEKEQEPKAPYPRSLIRPNTLIKVLPSVSKLALDSLIEEFQEMETLTDHLREIARTPFDASELDSLDKGQLTLAKEVGLLGIHEGTEQSAERYRVPELYRLALSMTRKGQS